MNSRLGILISGRGSNLQSIAAAVHDGRLDATVGVVISDRRDAAGLQLARAAGIDAQWIDPREYVDRAAYDLAIAGALRARQIDLVCLAGFMRLVGSAPPRGVPRSGAEYSSVAAAVVPRARCAAAGAPARRAGLRRDRAPGHSRSSTTARSFFRQPSRSSTLTPWRRCRRGF